MSTHNAAPVDQAAGLRRMAQPNPVQVIAVTSGKGGVGKTNVSVNLSVALAEAGHRVMLMDADMGLANVDVTLGLNPAANLSHVLRGEKTLEEILVQGPAGITIVPASSGIRQMAELGAMEQAGVIRAFGELNQELDYLLVDTAAGIAGSVLSFARAAQEVITVVCDEPSSITDAYATIKVLSRDCGVTRFRVLANRVAGPAQGRELYEKLSRVTDRFLDVNLDFLGSVPEDPCLQRAIRSQRAVVQAYPGSPAGQAFRDLARRVDAWPRPSRVEGHLAFFMERLIRSSAPDLAGVAS